MAKSALPGCYGYVNCLNLLLCRVVVQPMERYCLGAAFVICMAELGEAITFREAHQHSQALKYIKHRPSVAQFHGSLACKHASS